MVRTINRQPYTVKQLDYSDVKYKFFNHSNWKGVCDDKNYLGVDQETFADSKNVYVDSEGILKSRPSVKQFNLFYNALQYIYDIWTFGEWTVYEVRFNNAPALIFGKGQFISERIPVTNDFKLVLADRKIFIFEKDALSYIDLTVSSLSEITKIDATKKVYVPITEIVTKGTRTDNESPNVLTSSYITRYLYEKGDNVFDVLGKSGEVKILGTDETFNISDITNEKVSTLTKSLLKLKPSNYYNGIPLVFVNKEKSILLLGEYDVNNKFTLSFTIDGIKFTQLPALSSQIDCLPNISQSEDHVYAILHTVNGIYAYTLYAAKTVTTTYPVWTNICPFEVNNIGAVSLDVDAPSPQYGSAPEANSRLYQLTKTLVNRDPAVGDAIKYTQYDAMFTSNAPAEYMYVCVGTDPSKTTYEGFAWKTYYLDEIVYQYNYVNNSYVVTSTVLTPNFIGIDSDNVYVLSSDDIKYFVPNPKNGDSFLYPRYVLETKTLVVLRYTYINKWVVNIAANELYEGLPTQIGYYIDDKIYSGYFIGNYMTVPNYKEYTVSTKKNIILYSKNNDTIQYNIVANGSTLTDIQKYRRCAFDGKTAVDIDRTLNCKTYHINKGELENSLIKTRFFAPIGNTPLMYKLTQISVYVANNYIQISYIAPYSIGGGAPNRLVTSSINYSDEQFLSLTDYTDYCSEVIVDVNSECQIIIPPHPEKGEYYTTGFGFDLQSYYNMHLTEHDLISGSQISSLLLSGYPVSISTFGLYNIANNVLRTSNFDNGIQIDVTTQGKLTFDVFDHETELSQFFVSKGKNLYINAQGTNTDIDDFKWYFPKRNVQEFDYEITNLHPISTTEIAVFLKDSIYYVKPVMTTIDGIETIAYSYYKSRIPLGCEQGSDVITSYDNKYTMFVTKRGFVAMSYQDFISSEEQALTFLSDTIYDVFNKWNNGPVKLFQYNFWIILYRLDTGKAFIFDMRGNSWWPIEYNSNVKKFIEAGIPEYNNSEKKFIDAVRQPLLLSGLYLYKLDKSNDNYFDGNSLKDGRIDWFLSSQKLHLNAINYYKHIVNLTFFGYNYGDKDVNVRFNLRVINYRKQTDTNETKSFSAVDYKIQLTRTFVTRINYYKVNQVQYILESSRDEDAEDKIPVPLSLTAISLKYLVTGQVR